jgi:NAD(P)H-dependent FMN reductase
LLICGSLRAESTNSALLRTVESLLPGHVHADSYGGMAELPHFNPDEDVDPLPAVVADLRQRIGRATAILFSTPEYAGAMPGSLKNLLDWTVGGVEISDKPVGWINISPNPDGAARTYESLATVLNYTGARVVDAACVHIPVQRTAIGSDGLIHDESVRTEISQAVTTLLESA